MTSDDYYMISKMTKKYLHLGKISERAQSATVSVRVLPRKGRSYRRRGAVLLAGGGAGASVPCCAPRSLLSRGDDRRVATKQGQSPRSPGSQTKGMASMAEELAAVTRELPAHNQYIFFFKKAFCCAA